MARSSLSRKEIIEKDLKHHKGKKNFTIGPNSDKYNKLFTSFLNHI